MIVVYQGENVRTDALTVAAFLEERGIDGKKAIVEYAGEVYAPGADLGQIALGPGTSLDVFRIMAGG